ncbi:adenylyl-sulfate kinase [Scopulibacillus cellulosilyticus]|uniref:Adenylyl-sulfate kinase n=1 Tax=Scopulibacillus cellulosilyticus TaxID=2665665 RepID=A0ABW2Q2U7_9BACL
MSANITWHSASISKEERRSRAGHHSFVIWFTGLSGSGKSTLANAVAGRLFEDNLQSYVLDGDNIRFGLNKDLGFSETDRKENIRRIGEVAKLFVDSGSVVLTAFISPYKEDRESVRQLLEADEFVEVYVKCSLNECEKRDPKGLYQKARKGEIREFTGINAPYEEPENPEITIDSEYLTINQCVDQIIDYLKGNGFI